MALLGSLVMADGHGGAIEVVDIVQQKRDIERIAVQHMARVTSKLHNNLKSATTYRTKFARHCKIALVERNFYLYLQLQQLLEQTCLQNLQEIDVNTNR
jgi:hypothetical protein